MSGTWTFPNAALRASGLVLLLALFLPTRALAQTTVQPSAMSIGAPTTATLGQTVTLQAHLVDGTGAPIAKAPIYFVVPMSFLNVGGDVVVAQSVTKSDGVAAAIWQTRNTGTLTVRAEFRGDDRYAPASASASAPLNVTGSAQLYAEDVPVHLPGFNSAPIPALDGLWPGLTAWPIALVLLIVWTLYGRVAILLFHLARDSETPPVDFPWTTATAPALSPGLRLGNGSQSRDDEGNGTNAAHPEVL